MVNARSEYQVFSKNGWTEFDCREDSCSYTETTDTTDGTPKTVHTLTFDITGMGRDAQEALRRLLTCPSGVLAVITTPDSGMMLVGYSALLTTEYPLRVNRLETSSGTKPLDFCGHTVTLRSEDASPARRVVKYQ